MTPAQFLDRVLDPGIALAQSAGGPAPSDPARQILLTIALQESGPALTARYQNSPSVTPGPARSFFQFETAGVSGVLSHAASRVLSQTLCTMCEVIHQTNAVHRAIEGHDLLGAAFARLLLWTDPSAIPTEPDPAYSCYIRLWRPGKPRPADWPANWITASRTVQAMPYGAAATAAATS